MHLVHLIIHLVRVDKGQGLIINLILVQAYICICLIFSTKLAVYSQLKNSCLFFLSFLFLLFNMQSADHPDALQCKVCSVAYMVEKGSQFSLSHGFTPRQWLQTATTVTIMCVTLGAAWALIQLYSEPWIRMLAVSIGLLIQYICLRYESSYLCKLKDKYFSQRLSQFKHFLGEVASFLQKYLPILITF